MIFSFRCKEFEYPTELPTVSVIICHHNEAWSALARTVWSVINRTPTQLLAEIILVDDFSDKGDMQAFLTNHFETVQQRIVKIRSERRLGLVGARLLGAGRAVVIDLTLFCFVSFVLMQIICSGKSSNIFGFAL